MKTAVALRAVLRRLGEIYRERADKPPSGVDAERWIEMWMRFDRWRRR